MSLSSLTPNVAQHHVNITSCPVIADAQHQVNSRPMSLAWINEWLLVDPLDDVLMAIL